MGRPPWACNDKWSFLQLWRAKYLVARKEKKTKTFFPAFFAAYAALWPKPALHELVQPTPEDMALDEEGQEELALELLDVVGTPAGSDEVVAPKKVSKSGPLTLERVSNCESDECLLLTN